MEDATAGAAVFAVAVFDDVIISLGETATLAAAEDFAFDPAADVGRTAGGGGFFAVMVEDFAFDPALPVCLSIVPDTVFERATTATLLPSSSTFKRFCCSGVYLPHCDSTKTKQTPPLKEAYTDAVHPPMTLVPAGRSMRPRVQSGPKILGSAAAEAGDCVDFDLGAGAGGSTSSTGVNLNDADMKSLTPSRCAR